MVSEMIILNSHSIHVQTSNAEWKQQRLLGIEKTQSLIFFPWFHLFTFMTPLFVADSDEVMGTGELIQTQICAIKQFEKI